MSEGWEETLHQKQSRKKKVFHVEAKVKPECLDDVRRDKFPFAWKFFVEPYLEWAICGSYRTERAARDAMESFRKSRNQCSDMKDYRLRNE